MNPLIISHLIKAGHQVFLPVDGSNLIVLRIGGSLKECLCMNASKDQDRAPILRCPRGVKLIAVCDKTTGTVWLLDGPDQDGMTLRLGKRYEDYIIPEPVSLSFKEQKDVRKERDEMLRDQAMRAGERYDR